MGRRWPIHARTAGERNRSAAAGAAAALALSAIGVLGLATDVAGAAIADQYLWPMDGKVTSIYWECRSDCARYHRGIDVANGCDTPIYAARSGKVSFVGDDPNGYGNYVKVDHDFGHETLYAHMKTVSVREGDSVTTATVLGYEGKTGSATGCHVHFEVRQDDNGPDVETKQFIPGKIDDRVTRGTAIPFAMSLLKVTTTSDVLDGPNVDLVPGQGNARIGTATSGDRYVAWSSWKNSKGETWHSVSFDGRVGWIRSDRAATESGTAQRVTVDTSLNVRSGPGTTYSAIGKVFGAQEYHRVDSGKDDKGATWYKIHYHGTDGGSHGWIHGDYTKTVTYGGTPGPKPGFKDDVEGADPGWTATNDGGPARWAKTEARSSSPTHSWALRSYGANEKDALLSTSISLKDLSSPTLTVRSWMEGEQDCFLFSCTIYDYGKIEVTSDGGSTWRVLKDKYWSSGGKWETLEFDLSSDAGKTIRLRFTFHSDGATHEEGWYLDDFEVSGDGGGGGGEEPRFEDDVEGADPGWRTTNDGGSARWAKTQARASSPTHSWAIRDYGPNEKDTLLSPSISLAGLSAAKLTVRSWMEGERECFLFSCTIYDYGKIEVTSDGGSTWRVLKDKYWSSSGSWETLELDLASEAGKNIQLRFTFVSDGGTENEGWYLDDWKVA